MNSFYKLFRYLIITFALVTSFISETYSQYQSYFSIAGPTSICTGTSYTYSTSGFTGPDVVYWSISGGYFIGNSYGPSVTVVWSSTHGTLSATSSHFDCNNGCIEPCEVLQQSSDPTPIDSYPMDCYYYYFDSHPFSIVALAKPVVAVSGETTVCEGSSVELSTTGSYSFQWQMNGVNIQGATLRNFSASETGSYTVVASLSGCSETSTAVSINVNPNPPKPSLTSISTELIPGATVLLAEGGVNYKWFNNGSIISDNNDNRFVALKAGDYSVASFDNGCYNQSSIISVTNENNYNFLVGNDIKISGILNYDQLLNIDPDDIIQSIVYMDGQGKALQTVQRQSSIDKKDIITPFQYDELGRQVREYLPMKVDQNSGFPMTNILSGTFNGYNNSPHHIFYAQASPTRASSNRPFSESIFFPSPLNRVRTQSYLGTDFSTRLINYLANESNTIRMWSISENGLPFSTETWPANTLSITRIATAVSSINNYQAETEVVTNLEGLKLVERKRDEWWLPWSYTYYVYDLRNNLRFILPPELMKITSSVGNFFLTQEQVDSWAYQYFYDNEDRLIKSKSPGVGWSYAVYDSRDRLVLSQTAMQWQSNEWSYTKYDEFDRPVITGTYRPGSAITREEMQAIINALNNGLGYQNISSLENSSAAFPTVNDEALVISYYDNYGNCSVCNEELFQFSDENWNSTPLDGMFVPFERVVNLNVATSKKVLGTEQWIHAVTYYNKYHQPIQTVMLNQKGIIERTSVLYDFSGQEIQKIFNSDNQTIATRYTYDHAGRLLKTYHKFNNEPEIILTENEFNELGQLITKKLHSEDEGNSFLQSVDYRYTIEGNLKSLNYPMTDDDYFGMQLGFKDQLPTQNTIRYDGMITGTIWKYNSQGKEHSFNYSYTNLGSLKSASYKEKISSSFFSQPYFTEDNISYDLNGNIKSLRRFKRHGYNANVIDDLEYIYSSGNSLAKVNDKASAQFKDLGFKDGNNTDADYLYDLNGNLVVDNNKELTITYNFLNLPETVSFSDGSYISYKYDASGMRLTQTVFNNNNEPVEKTDYTSQFIYENDELDKIFHQEGHIKSVGTQNEYYYYISDHLGSPRVVLSNKESIAESVATLETISGDEEYSEFLYYDEAVRVNSEIFNHTDNSSTFYSTRLSGSAQERYGLAKSLSVMPGDTVRFEVFAKYLDPNSSNWTAALTDFISSIAQSTAAPGTFIDGGLTGSTGGVTPNYISLINKQNQTGQAPKAYLNWIIFDREINYLNGGFIRLTEVAKENGSNVSHEHLSNTLIIQEPGYVYLYLSNENETPIEVYFDDFKVEHIQSPVVQMNDYYAYGLLASSYLREDQRHTNYLFQGKQYDSLTMWYDFHARQYDPSLGRWLSVDPKSQFTSPYLFGFNIPVMTVDPDGELAWFVPVIIGAVAGGYSGYQIGKSRGASGSDLFAYTFGGAVIGGFTGGIGSSLSTTSGAVIAGGLNGAAMSAMSGGGIERGALYGAIGGLIGSTTSSLNIHGIVPGALFGAGTSGLISGGVSSLSGGSFSDGFRSGAISGGILGGIGGGISAAQSRYERNIWFGNATTSGKMARIADLAIANDVYNNGVNRILYDAGEAVNGETIPVIAQTEFNDLQDAIEIGSGLRSNIHMNLRRSLRQIESTFLHEFNHANDLFTGTAKRIYDSYGGNLRMTHAHLEMRSYIVNYNNGYRTSYYAGRVTAWTNAIHNPALYRSLRLGLPGL